MHVVSRQTYLEYLHPVIVFKAKMHVEKMHVERVDFGSGTTHKGRFQNPTHGSCCRYGGVGRVACGWVVIVRLICDSAFNMYAVMIKTCAGSRCT